MLDYRYRGKRCRPVLGYNLSPDQERDMALKVMTAIHSNLGSLVPSDRSAYPSFAEFAPRYLAYLQAKKLAALDRPTTIMKLHLVPHFGMVSLNEIAMEHGLAYLAQRRAAGASEGTLARECGVLQAVLNYAVAIEALDKNRLKMLPSPRWESRERVITGEELLRLFRMGPDSLRRIMVVALLTTLRESKIIETHQEWLVQRADGWWMMPSPGSRHKRVPKEVPLTDLAIRALYGQQARIGGRFFSQWKNANSFKPQWGKFCRRAGVHDLTFHDLRHTAATWLLEAGVDFAVIEKLLGHRLHGMGDGYIHNWEHRLRDAVMRLEAVVIEKFRQAEAQEGADVGSYGQLTGSWKNDETSKPAKHGAEGQNRAVAISLAKAVIRGTPSPNSLSTILKTIRKVNVWLKRSRLIVQHDYNPCKPLLSTHHGTLAAPPCR
jgi:integrase